MRKYEPVQLYEPDVTAPGGFRIARFAVTSGPGEEVCRGSSLDEVVLRLAALGIPREDVLLASRSAGRGFTE